MAQATDLPTTSRFHNLSSGALADALGRADAVLKGAEAECKALKDEIKRRGLLEARLRLRFGGALSRVPNRLAFPDFHSRLAQLLSLLGTDVEPFQFQSKVTRLGTPAGPLSS